MPDKEHEEQKKSLTDLFSTKELKTFFLRYLTIIGCLEIFIFVIALFSILEPYPSSFPWRQYFYASFAIPIGITFILGIIIIAFNTFYFKDVKHFESDHLESVDMSKARIFLNLSWQFQFVLFLLVLGLGALFMFHMDDILALMANAGERALNAILIFTGILFTGAILFGFIYLWFHYKLRKKRMEHAYQYKWELMNRTGMLILDDNTVIDKEGKIINRPGVFHDQANHIKTISAKDVSLLPNIPRKQSGSE